MEQDHIISEVRKNREELSARFNHDLNKLFDHYKKEQKKSKAKVKNYQPEKKADSTQCTGTE
jgi:inorganic pyrophosphatase